MLPQAEAAFCASPKNIQVVAGEQISCHHLRASTNAMMIWYGRRESNPRLELGRLSRYHYATPAHNTYSNGPALIRQVASIDDFRFPIYD